MSPDHAARHRLCDAARRQGRWPVLEALDRNRRFIKGEVARRINLRYAPEIRFRRDETFEEASPHRCAPAFREGAPRPRRGAGEAEDDAPMTIEDLRSEPAPGCGRAARAAKPAAPHQRSAAPEEARGQWLARPRQARRHDLDACGRGREAPLQRQEGRPCRHARSLWPPGLLPIAFGEATKTVPFVMDGRKGYRFTVSWGEERDTR